MRIKHAGKSSWKLNKAGQIGTAKGKMSFRKKCVRMSIHTHYEMKEVFYTHTQKPNQTKTNRSLRFEKIVSPSKKQTVETSTYQQLYLLSEHPYVSLLLHRLQQIVAALCVSFFSHWSVLHLQTVD